MSNKNTLKNYRKGLQNMRVEATVGKEEKELGEYFLPKLIW